MKYGFIKVAAASPALRVGDTVLVETSCSRAWKDVTYACGAGELPELCEEFTYLGSYSEVV